MEMEKFNILVCDDEKSIVDAIEIYLKQENYNIIKAYNGEEALQALEENEIHLILLDIMMPKLDGLNTTIKIRERLNIPIIILSAKSEDTDKILGLNFGADDYITKPFNPLELLARVKSQMRRYTTLGSIAEKSNIIKIGSLELDKDAKEVRVEGEKVKLTATEYGILQLLMENAGKVFSIDQIYENVWKELSFAPENTVSVHIRRIREKIEINPKEPRYLKVVWGIGYKIEKS
ncbi:Transcriptional regulatory protein WalR [Clostridium sp. MD294]|nr:Transcriptional regulatory protein WalR [Clostridium sp. MD294]